MLITLPFFVLSQFFYKGLSPEREAEVELFFSNVDTEVVVEDTELSIKMDNQQHTMLGRLIINSISSSVITNASAKPTMGDEGCSLLLLLLSL